MKVCINGEWMVVEGDSMNRLLDVLRQEHLTGTKEGCSEGECGACAVLVNNRLMNSCIVPIGSLEGASVVTIEGYRRTKKFQVLSDAYAQAGAVQCGFCIPGMMLASEALLSRHPHPTRQQIREGISGNLCRCTGYNMIVEAIERAAEEGDGLW